MGERHVRHRPGHVQGVAEIVQRHGADAAAAAVHEGGRWEPGGGGAVIGGGEASDGLGREGVDEVGVVGFGQERAWGANWKGLLLLLLLLRRVMVVRVRLRERR